jgi:hypothetical protein
VHLISEKLMVDRKRQSVERAQLWFVEGSRQESALAWACVVGAAAREHGHAIIDAYPDPGSLGGTVRQAEIDAYQQIATHKNKSYRELMDIRLSLAEPGNSSAVATFGPLSIRARVVVDRESAFRAGIDDEGASLWIEANTNDMNTLKSEFERLGIMASVSAKNETT